MQKTGGSSGPKSSKIRVFVVDDHPIILDALEHLFENSSRIKLVGAVPSGRKALEMVEEARPDVVLMDVLMKDLNGAQTTQALLARFPELKVMAYSALSDPGTVVAMFNAGAKGYFLKDQPPSHLIPAIETVHNGGLYYAPNLRSMPPRKEAPQPPPARGLESLTESECRVLSLVADGFSNGEIAEQLKLSSRTVEKHRQHMMEKLGLRNTAEIIKFAIRHGMSTLM